MKNPPRLIANKDFVRYQDSISELESLREFHDERAFLELACSILDACERARIYDEHSDPLKGERELDRLAAQDLPAQLNAFKKIISFAKSYPRITGVTLLSSRQKTGIDFHPRGDEKQNSSMLFIEFFDEYASTLSEFVAARGGPWLHHTQYCNLLYPEKIMSGTDEIARNCDLSGIRAGVAFSTLD